MANKDVYMDTRVFTDIVNRIGVASSKCVLSADPLSKTDIFEETSVGKEMNEILKLYYKSTEVYRNETSDSLPRALLKVRDSMIEQDKILSEGLTIEKNRR